jgi:hypothetical protein
MRRSVGIQCLECHLITTRQPSEAQVIVANVNDVCTKYKLTLNQKTNLFQYSPFPGIKNDKNIVTTSELLSNNNQQNVKVVNSECISVNKSLPPKSPYNGNRIPHKVVETQIDNKKYNKTTNEETFFYDAYIENPDTKTKTKVSVNLDSNPKIKSRSVSNMSSKSSSSLFNKLKSNLHKNKTTKENTKKNALISASEIGFKDNNTNFDILKQRPASAMSKNEPVRIISNTETKILMNPSTVSLGSPSVTNGEDGKDTWGSSKSKGEKKLSLGKRLLQSARSSLKSNNSSVSSKKSNSSSASKKLASASSVSFKKEDENANKNLADIDFRKSRTSIFDDTLLIDGTSFSPIPAMHPPMPPKRPATSLAVSSSDFKLRNQTNNFSSASVSNFASNKDSNFILKTRSPAANQQNIKPTFRSLTPCSLKLSEKNYLSSPSLHNYQFKAATNYTSFPSPNVRTVSTGPMMRKEIAQIDYRDYARQQHGYELCDEDDFDGSDFCSRPSRNEKRLVNDPKMFSNHLVWNNASKSAECLDKIALSPQSSMINIIHVNNPDPVARALSPGFSILTPPPSMRQLKNLASRPPQPFGEPRPSSRVEREIKIEYTQPSAAQTEIFMSPNSIINSRSEVSSTAFGHGAQFSHKYSSSTKDSAYNTTSSNEDADGEKVTTFRSSFSNRDKFENKKNAHATTHVENVFKKDERCQTVETETKISNEQSVISRLKQQFEENEENRKAKMSSNSHKIVGGVKVFPSLPHQHRQAAVEARKSRLNALEASLNELEKRSINKEYLSPMLPRQNNLFSSSRSKFEQSEQHNSSLLTIEDTSSDNDHEIIDLTKIKNMEYKRNNNISDKLACYLFKDEYKKEEKTSSSVTKSSETNIPVKLVSSRSGSYRNNEITKSEFESEFNSKLSTPVGEFSHNSSIVNTNDTSSILSTDHEHQQSTLDKQNQKINYIYYFDNNEHFGGY